MFFFYMYVVHSMLIGVNQPRRWPDSRSNLILNIKQNHMPGITNQEFILKPHEFFALACKGLVCSFHLQFITEYSQSRNCLV